MFFSSGAAICMAGVLDYLCVEMLELSNVKKPTQISDYDIYDAVSQDEELHELLKHVTISRVA